MTETNNPTFPTPQAGEAANTATSTAATNAARPESSTAAPLATMPEPSTAEVSTNPFSDLVASSQGNDSGAPSFPNASSGPASTAAGSSSYSPPAGPPPATFSGSPLPPQQPQPQTQQNEQGGDPRVVGLKAMFPDYDDLILLSVLDSVNGNQERAIDVLLGMSDPNYVSEPQAQPQAAQQPAQPAPGAGHGPQPSQVGMTQEELDEQFARQLMLEEQQQQQQQWETQYRVRQNRPNFQQPARPDQHGWQPQPGAQGGQGQGTDTVADLQQSFTRIAETGKKTFGNIFSKVKAKIQEFDQPRPGQPGAGPPPNVNPSTYPSAYQYGAGGTAPSDSWETGQYEHRISMNPPQIPATTRPQGLDSPSPPLAQPAAPAQIAQPVPTVQGYDATPEPARETTPKPTAPVVTTPPVATANLSASGSGPASPPRTGSGFGGATPKPMDAGKLGLLPKKPVSLLRPENSAPQPVARQDSEDSDGLEYAESPFDDHRRK